MKPGGRRRARRGVKWRSPPAGTIDRSVYRATCEMNAVPSALADAQSPPLPGAGRTEWRRASQSGADAIPRLRRPFVSLASPLTVCLRQMREIAAVTERSAARGLPFARAAARRRRRVGRHTSRPRSIPPRICERPLSSPSPGRRGRALQQLRSSIALTLHKISNITHQDSADALGSITCRCTQFEELNSNLGHQDSLGTAHSLRKVPTEVINPCSRK
jgi:hypothetical protein